MTDAIKSFWDYHFSINDFYIICANFGAPNIQLKRYLLLQELYTEETVFAIPVCLKFLNLPLYKTLGIITMHNGRKTKQSKLCKNGYLYIKTQSKMVKIH